MIPVSFLSFYCLAIFTIVAEVIFNLFFVQVLLKLFSTNVFHEYLGLFFHFDFFFLPNFVMDFIFFMCFFEVKKLPQLYFNSLVPFDLFLCCI